MKLITIPEAWLFGQIQKVKPQWTVPLTSYNGLNLMSDMGGGSLNRPIEGKQISFIAQQNGGAGNNLRLRLIHIAQVPENTGAGGYTKIEVEDSNSPFTVNGSASPPNSGAWGPFDCLANIVGFEWEQFGGSAAAVDLQLFWMFS